MLRSRFSRLALMMALLPTVVMMLVGGVIYQKIDADLTRAYDLRLNDEIASLSEAFASGGQAELRRVIQARNKMYPSNHDRVQYGVFAKDAVLTAGGLAMHPITDGFTEKDGQRLRVTPLNKDVNLAVASSTADRAATLSALFWNLMLAVLACLIPRLA